MSGESIELILNQHSILHRMMSNSCTGHTPLVSTGLVPFRRKVPSPSPSPPLISFEDMPAKLVTFDETGIYHVHYLLSYVIICPFIMYVPRVCSFIILYICRIEVSMFIEVTTLIKRSF
jgi:hypothetical protein